MDEAAAAGVVKQIEQGGGRAVAVQADLGTVAGVRAMFAEALTHLGHLDVLVNNAGVIVPGPIGQMTEEDYERTFAVNARGVFFALQEAARSLSDGGRVVSVSSVNTAFSPPTAAAYSGSKAALEQFTRTAAKELGGRGITVNAVSPGATDTDMFAAAPPERREQAKHMSPFGRLGEPADIADVVAFLVSEQARWITGQIVPVNGGIA
jgi:3-oxoacyl-[acyl-carrier protein] reductase